MHRFMATITKIAAGLIILMTIHEVWNFLVIDRGSIKAYRQRKYAEKVINHKARMANLNLSIVGLMNTYATSDRPYAPKKMPFFFRGFDRARMQVGISLDDFTMGDDGLGPQRTW